ncbi:ring-cleaving dioxygenase [Profundibacterium mesophilum]|uniref:Lactoylglutathione lyase n=1 Tax=Profundibacterium mesophilum KAUST100406-0324 TaxID=1037889 RepID=A0A921NXI2_9RHOB|nr:ring-cleaving dioxygenase [Profundibacterium mesophilum]KAF0676554.1 lactoylglutathione lyase [Profundibacterium mesophilum KAUST100406-0324]
MLKQITGLHHVTALGSDARRNNAFFTDILGLRRVKKTVNFDAPDVYHLYYGDETGSPGSVMTYFPFPGAGRGKPGTGEVGATGFAIPEGSSTAWAERLAQKGVTAITPEERFGETRLSFDGPDGERLVLVESADPRAPWTGGDIGAEQAIRGFHSASMRLRDVGATRELLGFMGYETLGRENGVTRLAVPGGGPAAIVDLEELPMAGHAAQGAGSVHHIAFAVENRARQLEVREALLDTGYQVTPVIDRDYFWAIYFRPPGGVLFEVATNEPGFTRDEPQDHLGETLKLPSQHEHLRARLERHLAPIGDAA